MTRDRASVERPSVLIVEDNASLLLLLAEIFRLAGFEVSLASEGSEALENIRSSHPDLIVLDVGLPGRNGFEVCRSVREDAATEHIAVILMTARTGDADRHWGFDAGADDYLSKPFDPDQLVQRAREILSTRRNGESRNPLTQLPDLASLGRRAGTLRKAGIEVTVRALEFEAEAATVFRRKYGDMASAEAIRLAAACLRRAVDAIGDPTCSVGHAGDASYSRFAVIGAVNHTAEAIRAATSRFDREVKRLYDERDRQQGGISVPRAEGGFAATPFLSLRVIEAEDLQGSIEDAA